jgi:ribosome biogenesis protein BMS1
MRTWYPISPVVYYNPVNGHWLPKGQVWFAMKTVGQLRYERNLPTPHNADSLYRDVERLERQFNPLRIPSRLEQTLPFADKMAVLPAAQQQQQQQKQKQLQQQSKRKKARTDDDAGGEGRILVRDKAEKQHDDLLSDLELIRADKLAKEKVRTAAKIEKRQRERDEFETRMKDFIKKSRKKDLLKVTRCTLQEKEKHTS